MLWIVRTAVAGLALGLPFAPASASVIPQARDSDPRVSPSLSETVPFSGEIKLAFDAAVNKTRVRFSSSLASGNVLVRVFLGAPAVHTLIAEYEFGGRAPGYRPALVRVSLISDEYKQTSSPDFPLLGVDPILAVSLGDTVARYHLGIAQMVEEWLAPARTSSVSPPPRGDDAIRYYEQLLPREIHIERTATAFIPICDFLALVSARNVHGTVAGLDFDLNDGVVSGLRQFAAKMTPEAAAQDRTNCR
jgi:hypothetical protein